MAQSQSIQMSNACSASPRFAIASGAEAIGDRLCRNAIWHGSLCNWFGRSFEELHEPTRTVAPAVTALDGDLYGGSSGCGLFLAFLARASGAAAHRRTAIAALQRSLAVSDRLEPGGLFTGRIGVAYAAALGGRALDDAELVEAGRSLGRGSLERVLAMPHGSEPLDVIDGLAGAIQALLAIARVAADRELEDGACALAQKLAARGRTAEGGGVWCWRDPAALEEPPLTGMSHGAAGIGLALLEAYLASGDGELLEAARGAFHYEDTRYVADQRNWLDLRAGAEDAPDAAASCGLTWCHGAPGIALARMRALEICAGEQGWRHDADAALVTTRTELARRRRQSGLDATLCHGTCGLAEVLLVAGEHTERIDARGARADAEAFAAEVAVAWSRGDQVSGVPSGGSNPSLMLGSAGVGWFLLRVLDPAGVPAILGAPGRWTA